MKTLSLGERAVAAIARYERAAGELTRIKKGIVAELDKCPITIEAYKTFDDKPPLWDKGRVNHHLHQAITTTAWDGTRLDEEEITDELTGSYDNTDWACPHCLAAWSLLLSRRKARQEFGHAKRAVRALGKIALEEQAP